jgi:pyrroloquinoline quinone biosynthesis protein D
MNNAAPRSREAIPCIARLYRFQWEPAQNAYVLLFPEGMVNLNVTAGEILRRCNDQDSAARIIADLQRVFESDDIGPEVDEFLQSAAQNGWIEWRDPVAS